jgi:hypothetical protein
MVVACLKSHHCRGMDGRQEVERDGQVESIISIERARGNGSIHSDESPKCGLRRPSYILRQNGEPAMLLKLSLCKKTC